MQFVWDVTTHQYNLQIGVESSPAIILFLCYNLQSIDTLSLWEKILPFKRINYMYISIQAASHPDEYKYIHKVMMARASQMS